MGAGVEVIENERELELITYLVPYFPVTPTFLVRLVIFAVVAVMNFGWMGSTQEVEFRL